MTSTLEIINQIERQSTLDFMGRIEAQPPSPKTKAPSPPIFGAPPGYQPSGEPVTFEEARAKLEPPLEVLWRRSVEKPLTDLWHGYKRGAAGMYDLAANAIMLSSKFNDLMVSETGLGAPAAETFWPQAEEYLRSAAQRIMPKDQAEDFMGKVYEGLGSVPAYVAELLPASRMVGGSMAGFAGVEALAAAQGTPEEILEAALRGFFMGGAFKAAAPLTRPARAVGLGVVGAGAALPEGDVSDVAASAATLAILGATGGRGSVRTRDVFRQNLSPEVREKFEAAISGKIEAILEPVAAEAARPALPAPPAPRRPVTPTPEAPQMPAGARPAVPGVPTLAKPEIRTTEAPATPQAPSGVKLTEPIQEILPPETLRPLTIAEKEQYARARREGLNVAPVEPVELVRKLKNDLIRSLTGLLEPNLTKEDIAALNKRVSYDRAQLKRMAVSEKEIAETEAFAKPENIYEGYPGPRPTEPTPQGEQALIPGVKPVMTPERLAVEGKRPLAGPVAPFGETPLGDVAGRGQMDIVEATRAKAIAPPREPDLVFTRIPKQGEEMRLAAAQIRELADAEGNVRLAFRLPKTGEIIFSDTIQARPGPLVDFFQSASRTRKAFRKPGKRKPPTKTEPKSLLEFLSVKGLKEERGELAAMDADKWHTEKLFRKKLVRPAGQELDLAREAAAEAGYLPADSTVVDLLALIDRELRGEPIYSELDRGLVEQRAVEGEWENVVIQSADRLGIEVAGRKFEEISQEVERRMRNDPEARAEVDHLYAGLPIPVSALQRLGASAFDKAYDLVGWRFSPLGKLPQQRDYLIRRYLTLGKTGEIDKLGYQIYRTLSRASEADSQAILDYFTTSGAKPTEISPAMRADAIKVKQAVRKVGASLVEAGLLPREIYEANKDSYLPQAYYRYIHDLVSRSTGIKAGKQGYLKAKKNIPEHIRMLELGQITDPAFLGAKAISEPLRDLVILDFLNSVSENVAWALPESFVRWHGQRVTPYWLKAEAERVREQSRNYGDNRKTMALARADEMDAVADAAIGDISGKVPDDYRQMPKSKRYGLLSGMYVRKEIYNDVVGAIQFVTGESIAQRILGHGGAFTKINQIWKLSKVALNPPTQVRNFVSNGILIHIDGVPLHRVPDMVIAAIRDMASDGQYWQVAKKYGVTATTFAQNEMFQVKTDLLRLKHKDSPMKWLFEAGKVVNMASTVYGLSEGLFKTARIMYAMKHEGMSEADAALAAHRAVFDYSLNPASVTYLRNAPVGPPFITFYYKMTGRIIETALKRPTKFLPYVLIPMALTAMIAADYDVSTEDLETLKLALPEWLRERGHTFILPWKDQHGRWQVVDYGYMLPWSLHWEVVKNSAKGNIRAVIDSTGMGGAPLGQLIVAIKSNIDPFTKRPISNPADPPNKQLADWMNWLWRAAGPTWLTDHGAAMKLYQALTDEVTRTGEPGYTTTQAAFRFAGINIYPIDPVQSRLRNIRWAEFEIREIERRMKSLLRDRSLDAEERGAIIKEYRVWLKEKQEALIRYEKESRVPEALR